MHRIISEKKNSNDHDQDHVFTKSHSGLYTKFIFLDLEIEGFSHF